ncbi:hypothetical protein B0A48_17996 [Cryoendolithus antarcticus]|uniref:Aminotransferase n=1 Tax=Cryoendolithus antarcticus TaxID=1507870 RepID=A0A1V8SA24_9PEZI|nr:hypothetical protein B0A48_17996 [Cryoendolithus antarcticus]
MGSIGEDEVQHNGTTDLGSLLHKTGLTAKKSTSAVLHRSLHHDPHQAGHAKGNYLYLSNGQKIFDATGGAAVACLGSNDERVTRALIEQLTNGVSYCHSLFFATDAVEQLASLLISSTNNIMARAFFTSSGSEANEAALKMARQYFLEKPQPEPQRTHFIGREQSYHGTTLGALGVGGHRARRKLYEPMLSRNASFVSACFGYRGRLCVDETDKAYVARLEAELEAEFQRVGPRNVVAFIAEPVVGAALGCVPSVPGYFAAMRRVCDKHGALLIMDEIMCGTGRVGPAPSAAFPNPLHAWQDPSVGVAPDIMTMGKALGGGSLPVAAMLINERVVNALAQGSGAFSHGQTYQAHPLACRAALEVQQIIRKDDLVSNVREQGALLGKLLKSSLADHPCVGDIRGQGLFWGIEFVRDKSSKEPFDSADGVAAGIHELGMRPPFNISIYPGNGSCDGERGDHILLAPAFNVTKVDIEHITDTVTRVIETYFDSKLSLPHVEKDSS